MGVIAPHHADSTRPLFNQLCRLMVSPVDQRHVAFLQWLIVQPFALVFVGYFHRDQLQVHQIDRAR